jgi:hypothetical protein
MEITNSIFRYPKEKIMSHMYAIARQLQAPGVRTTATFNPARLTSSLRNMTRKSIASGYHIGGWSSKSRDVRKLLFQIAGEHPIVYVEQSADYMTLHTPREISASVQSVIMGMFEADCALQKMDYDGLDNGRYRPTRADFYETIDVRCKENITKMKFAHQSSHYYMIVRTPKIKQQIAEEFLKERTIEEIAIAERIARYLDDDLEYNVPTTHEF